MLGTTSRNSDDVFDIDEESRNDLRNELVEYETLVANLTSTLRSEHDELDLPATALQLEARCRKVIEMLRVALVRPKVSADLRTLSQARVEFHGSCRQLYRLCGALQTLNNWQSPVFLSSDEIPAGRHHPALSERSHDYSRDRHIDAEVYEQLFLAQFLPASVGPSYAWLTSCGMSAVVLGMECIRSRLPAGARILARSDMYHETRELLSRWFGADVEWLPKESTDVVSALRSGEYSAVFLDAHTNASQLRCPAIDPLLRYVVEQGERAPYVLCDTSALPLAASHWLSACSPMPPGKVYFAESLIKFHQFGLDTTNAGILLGLGQCQQNDDLWYLRAHLGVNISDTSAATLPRPNRILLHSRLRRMERNARIIGESVTPLLGSAGGNRLGQVTSPALRGHTDRAILENLPFKGALVSIELRHTLHTSDALYTLARSIVHRAASRGLVLHGGSSFGFSTTRVYVTAATTQWGRPFLRIAAGSESVGEATAIAGAIYDAASRLA